MVDDRFDALVVGAGPAGSIAALVLARGGARVALVDKATFPRDKACGDLVGPRGVQLLTDLDLIVPGAIPVRDMIVVGPTGRRVRLPCFPGRTYSDHALAVPRTSFDAMLREAAVAAGAVPFIGQAVEPLEGSSGIDGFALAGGIRLRADTIVGADGATTRVGEAAGLVDHDRVMWGFAIRSYLDQVVDLPAIVLWEPSRWRALPGYGWLFPGPDGRANVGLGVGTLADRTTASQAVQRMPEFLDHLQHLDLLSAGPHPSARLGGWLKMGMVGTTPAAGRVLLVGDAAGLVNPLQGEGIAQAMRSGHAAATAILSTSGRPGHAAMRYRAGWPTSTCRITQSLRPYRRRCSPTRSPSPGWAASSPCRSSARHWRPDGPSSGTSCSPGPHPAGRGPRPRSRLASAAPPPPERARPSG